MADGGAAQARRSRIGSRPTIGVILFAALLAPTPAVASDNPTLEEVATESEPGAQPLVFNGVAVDNPGWVVSITKQGSYTCAGTLIHAVWVLTAAHCVADTDSTFRVHVGADRWFEGHERTLSQVHIHPGYEDSDIHSIDLAMVRLDSAIPNPALTVLAGSSSWPVMGQPLIVVGWGLTSDTIAIPDLLQGGGVEVHSDSTGALNESFCPREAVAPSGYDDFCFGGTSWACSGDSGGPLIGRASPNHTTGTLETIYGVTSFGLGGCSSALWDTVAQSVGPHGKWIRSFLWPSIGDEMFFYRSTDGAFRYYDMKPNGALGALILSGSGYSTGWSAITAVDLDGDGGDEKFFYRSTDGAFRYYSVDSNASLGSPILSGSGYSTGWSAITAVDLNGDGKDEMFFYRSTDGAYRYYTMRPDGTLATLLQGGTGYSLGWTSITAVDLNGDGKDEMFFYRSTDGAYRYYTMRPDGTLATLLQGGSGYSLGWTSITAVDLNGDGKDEMFFYRSDGTFRYYRMRPDGRFHSLVASGSGYSSGWSSISAVDLDGDDDDELLFYRNDGTFKYYRTSNTGIGSLIRSGTGYSNDWTSISSVNLR